MTTKLTLTIEQDVIRTAKSYAQKKGRSLSDLVENYLKTLASKDNQSEELSPRVRRLVGAVKLSKDFNYKQALQGGIQKKHGK
jgi:uncharacterized protein (DUF3820 family)